MNKLNRIGKSLKNFTYTDKETADDIYSAINSTQFLGVSVSMILIDYIKCKCRGCPFPPLPTQKSKAVELIKIRRELCLKPSAVNTIYCFSSLVSKSTNEYQRQ